MSKPKYFATGGAGQYALDNFYYSQAVRIDNRIEIAGQGGWTDAFEFPAKTIVEEIDIAFENVSRVLADTGATWDDVIQVNSYHCQTDLEAKPAPGSAHLAIDGNALGAMVAQFRARMKHHAPVWTCIGVSGLGHPSMRVEIRVTAQLTS
jgi:enamine deaminase RidA (YjgF/YER057c/UK114 family)